MNTMDKLDTDCLLLYSLALLLLGTLYTSQKIQDKYFQVLYLGFKLFYLTLLSLDLENTDTRICGKYKEV